MSFEPPSPLMRGDSDVIVLEDVKSEEFDALCSIFYPEYVLPSHRQLDMALM